MDANKKARAEALESLRARHLEDLEAIYTRQFTIAAGKESQDRDAVNAAKNCMTMMGVSRPGPEKPPEAPKEKVHTEAPAPISDERMAEILAKIAK